MLVIICLLDNDLKMWLVFKFEFELEFFKIPDVKYHCDLWDLFFSSD